MPILLILYFPGGHFEYLLLSLIQNVELIVNLIVPFDSWTMKLGGGGGVCHTN